MAQPDTAIVNGFPEAVTVGGLRFGTPGEFANETRDAGGAKEKAGLPTKTVPVKKSHVPATVPAETVNWADCVWPDAIAMLIPAAPGLCMKRQSYGVIEAPLGAFTTPVGPKAGITATDAASGRALGMAT